MINFHRLLGLAVTLVLILYVSTSTTHSGNGQYDHAPIYESDALLLDGEAFGIELDEATERNSEFQQGRDLLDSAWEALGKEDAVLAHHYFANAEQHFSNVLETNNENSAVLIILMHRATAYIGQGKHELALDDFDATLALDPVFVPAYEGKVLAYKKLGDFDKIQEMEEIIGTIYDSLASQVEDVEVALEPNVPPSPTSGSYGTWYANNTRHSYNNLLTGVFHPYDNGFGCQWWTPWKANIENAVYFNLPWITWNRHTEGLKAVGYLYWANLNGYLQGYTNVPPFQNWSVPAGENYVLLIHEHQVCIKNWVPITSYFRISTNYLP
jgi:tetratricopeptide (TPR) repeat protein